MVNYKLIPRPKLAAELLAASRSVVDVAGGRQLSCTIHSEVVLGVSEGRRGSKENGAAYYRFQCFGEAIGVCFERSASGAAICGSSHYPSLLHPCGDALQRHKEGVRRR